MKKSYDVSKGVRGPLGTVRKLKHTSELLVSLKALWCMINNAPWRLTRKQGAAFNRAGRVISNAEGGADE